MRAAPRARSSSLPTFIRTMADYLSIIARAVGTLDPNTAPARRRLYERARVALLSEMQSADPPFQRSEIMAAQMALEAVIETVEGDQPPREMVPSEPVETGHPDESVRLAPIATALPVECVATPVAASGPVPRPRVPAAGRPANRTAPSLHLVPVPGRNTFGDPARATPSMSRNISRRVVERGSRKCSNVRLSRRTTTSRTSPPGGRGAAACRRSSSRARAWPRRQAWNGVTPPHFAGVR
jgi:hypothetical protein